MFSFTTQTIIYNKKGLVKPFQMKFTFIHGRIGKDEKCAAGRIKTFRFSEETGTKKRAADGRPYGCSIAYSALASRTKFLKNSSPSPMQDTGMRSLVPWVQSRSDASALNGA